MGIFIMQFSCYRDTSHFEKWHKWFAWYPVRVEGVCVWLEQIERKYFYEEIYGVGYADSWEYRFIK